MAPTDRETTRSPQEIRLNRPPFEGLNLVDLLFATMDFEMESYIFADANGRESARSGELRWHFAGPEERFDYYGERSDGQSLTQVHPSDQSK